MARKTKTIKAKVTDTKPKGRKDPVIEPETKRQCPNCGAPERTDVKIGEWRFSCECYTKLETPAEAPIPATEPTPAVSSAPPGQISPPEAEIAHPGEAVAEKPPNLPPQLIERAKKVGFTNEQIASYTDPTELEMACHRIKPQVTPQPPKKRQLFRPFREKPKGKPAKATCISEISALRAVHVGRAGYDESNMGVFCRQHKPKILPGSIQKVTVVRDYVPNKKDILTSTITIDYLEG